uniref:Uncharacterized protein n=1 Tax=Arundo donax TaxID=35708 RepID=A0A0A9BXC5_ARUDO
MHYPEKETLKNSTLMKKFHSFQDYSLKYAVTYSKK